METTGDGAPRTSGRGLDLALLVLAVLLAVAVALGVLLVQDARDRRAADRAEQEQYAAVMAAARAEAEAAVNVRHGDGGASVDRIADGATGDLHEQYTTDRDDVLADLARDRTISKGTVSEVGVVRLSATTATVIVATDGTVATRRTDDKAVARDARLRLDLVLEGGRWLTSDLRVVD